jgi:hypothetical protein
MISILLDLLETFVKKVNFKKILLDFRLIRFWQGKLKHYFPTRLEKHTPEIHPKYDRISDRKCSKKYKLQPQTPQTTKLLSLASKT